MRKKKGLLKAAAPQTQSLSDEQVREQAAAWMLERPQCRALFEKFPPTCEVAPLRPLVCPRYGAPAWIVSYTDGGQVSVVQEGNSIQGYCDPEWLEAVRFNRGMTPAWVRSMFAADGEQSEPPKAPLKALEPPPLPPPSDSKG